MITSTCYTGIKHSPLNLAKKKIHNSNSKTTLKSLFLQEQA